MVNLEPREDQTHGHAGIWTATDVGSGRDKTRSSIKQKGLVAADKGSSREEYIEANK